MRAAVVRGVVRATVAEARAATAVVVVATMVAPAIVADNFINEGRSIIGRPLFYSGILIHILQKIVLCVR